MKIALIVLDTLRKDAFDEFFDWLPGHRFDRTFATSHWTVPVHTSLFTGRYASEVGTHSRTVSLNRDYKTIAERLYDNGYQTIGYSANPQITNQFGFDRGFSQYDTGWRARPFQKRIFDWRAYGADRSRLELYLGGLFKSVIGEYDTIPSINYGLGIKSGHEDDGAQRALSYLRNCSFRDDSFVFVNLMEAHGPYNPPSEYKTVEPVSVSGLQDTIAGGDYDVEATKTAYDDCVQYLSNIFKNIYAELEDAEFDLIFVCSDHGEMFGEHDGVWQHDYGLYPELTKVPLVVSGTEVGQQGTTDRLTSLLDVHATIERKVGLDQTSQGRDLFTEEGAGTVYTEYHGIPLEKKYNHLISEFDRSTVESYNAPLCGLSTKCGQYHWQTKDGIRPENASADMRDALGSYAETLQSRLKQSDSATDIPEHLESTLQDLGYM